MRITWDEMLEAQKAGYDVVIIVNGEYYEVNDDEEN